MLFKDLGVALAKHVAGARSEVFLAAPFVKVGALEKVLVGLRPEVKLTLLTRWRIDEIAAGVSDVDAHGSVVARGGSVLLLDHLHAKYYRSDDRVLAGSANLTFAALSWTPQPNLETLEESRLDEAALKFEELALSQASEVGADEAAVLLSLQKELRASTSLDFGTDNLDTDHYPLSLFDLLPRDPADVWRHYANRDCDDLGEASKERVRRFLAILGVPNGIRGRDSLHAAVGMALWQQKVVQDFHAWLGEGRRFGEVSAHLSDHQDGTNAKYLEQSVYRNLLFFLPQRFESSRPNHTEILRQRLGPSSS